MAGNHDADYWSLVYQVMQYAIDEMPKLDLVVGGRAVDALTASKFLEDLYVCEGKYEKQLARQLLLPSPLMLIIGARGCGKTSTIRYVLKAIEDRTDGRRVVLFDAKNLAAQDIFDDTNPTRFRRRVSMAISRQIQRELTNSDVDVSREILAWLLAGPADHKEEFEDSVLAPFDGLSVRVRTMAGAEEGERKTRLQKIVSWFQTSQNDFVERHREAEELIKPAHVLLAAARLAGLKAVTVIYDNVDRIPLHNQALFRSIVTDMLYGLSGFCSCAIAIREETALGNMQANKPGGHTVIFPSGDSYPALLMPDTTTSHIEGVFAKRFQYADDVYEKRTAEGTGDDATAHETRKVAHAGVVGQLLEDKFHALANGNLRIMLGIYLAFMQFLSTMRTKGVQHALARKNSERDPKHGGSLHTLFYVWLGAHGDQHGVPLYNLLEFGHVGRDARFNDIVSTRHYVMTCVWNLTGALRWEAPTGYTDFAHVFERLATLGFELRQIKQALQALTARPGGEPKMIEFRDERCDIDALTEHGHEKLKLTRMGRTLVAETSHKFGYVWSYAARQWRSARKRETPYFDLERHERLDIYLNYLREMAQVHIHVLSMARNCLVQEFSEDWLSAYRRDFGVNGRLQLERILESGLGFVRHHSKEKHRISLVLDAYRRLVEQLEEGCLLDELAFDALWAE